MSDNVQKYMGTVREYSKEIIMFLGFAIAFLVYTDFKNFMEKQTEVLQGIEKRLTEIEVEAQVMLNRTEKLEKKVQTNE